MAVNMAAKRLKYEYLSWKVSYKDKRGVDLDKAKVMESTSRSVNSFEVYIFKMAGNMAAKALSHVHLYISAHR